MILSLDAETKRYSMLYRSLPGGDSESAHYRVPQAARIRRRRPVLFIILC